MIGFQPATEKMVEVKVEALISWGLSTSQKFILVGHNFHNSSSAILRWFFFFCFRLYRPRAKRF